MWILSLGGEGPLEEGMATHSSIAWRIPWTEKPGKATVHRVAKSWTLLKQLSTQHPCLFPENESESCPVMSNSLPPRGLYSPWNSPGQNTGVGSFPFSRGSSNSGIEPRSSALQVGSVAAEPQGKPSSLPLGPPCLGAPLIECP